MSKDADSNGASPINLSAFGQVKLGRGVVGKTSYVAAIALIAAGAIGWSLTNQELKFVMGILVLVGLGGFLFFILRFAERNPQLALLEGADLIQWRQLEIAAKDQPPTIPTVNVAPPLVNESKPEE